MPNRSDVRLSFALLFGRRQLPDLPVVLAIIGMAIGVACLVIAMAVISGYETTLRGTVTSFVGHIIVIHRELEAQGQTEAQIKVEKEFSEIKASTPFALVDAAIVHNKKLNGVILNGVEPDSFRNVLRLEKNLIFGKLDFGADQNGRPLAVIGKGIAKKFGLKVGDVFRLVLPASSETDVSKLRPKVAVLTVAGVLDIGRHDFDTRYIFLGLKALQKFAAIGDRVTGFRLTLRNESDAEAVASKMNSKFGEIIKARSWVDVNYSLFEAAKIEKAIIFFVLLVIVFAAATNVAGTLFIMVFKRYSDVAILKTLGYSSSRVMQMFSFQGLIVGALGVILGIAVGYSFCQLFLWAQVKYSLVSGEVYKLDHIDVEVRLMDLLLISISSMAICFVATISPSARAARLLPTEGLRYE